MTNTEMDRYMDDNLAVYNAAMANKARREMCRDLEDRRKARERAAVLKRRHRRRVCAVLLITATLATAMAACSAATKNTAGDAMNHSPVSTKPVNATESMELLASQAPVLVIPKEWEEPLEDLPVWEWPEDVLLAHGYYSVAVPMEYEYQGYMRRYCEEYGILYTMALAVAEIESYFDMDKLGVVGEVGIMQLNPGPGGSYHDELEGATGLDPTTPEGNIAGGCYLLGKYMALYNDPIKAFMCYNMGQTGAKEAWAQGITSTKYTEKALEAMERWGCTVNAWNGV